MTALRRAPMPEPEAQEQRLTTITDTDRLDFLATAPALRDHPWSTLHALLNREPVPRWPTGVYRFDLRAAIDAAMSGGTGA